MMKFKEQGKTWFAYAFVFAFACPFFAGDDIMSGGEMAAQESFTRTP